VGDLTILDDLLTAAPVVSDGAWGTQLQERGLPIGACPDLWNLTEPDKVAGVARAYVEAGSRIILTNTFGANRFVLDRHGAGDQTVAIARAGVEISRAAAGEAVCVFASLGPSSKMVAMGEVSEDELRAAFDEAAGALADGGADGIVVESMSELAEAKLAVAAAAATGLPVVGSMVFDSGRDGMRTMMGETPEQAAEELAAAGAAAIGTNCGRGAEQIHPVCERLRAATGLPLWIKPNAGLPELIDGRAVYRTPPEEFARHMQGIVAAGANLVGGCCGTTPDHIRALVAILRG
jgi:5-methyltetrahydrofolate--homocysteine methyltransferase